MEHGLINDELIEATLLWFRRRLGSMEDAEDLSQDILTSALTAIRRGDRIESFYSWYWSMARNRLNMHYRKRANGAVSLELVAGVVAADASPLDDIISEEEERELSYAISRLSSLHRSVIVMYYLKQMKICDIARALGLPEGTVKRRLYDARQGIEKGVNNMKNNGRTAYAPYEVNLWGGYGMPSYWNRINDIMTKQIFAVCADEALTKREIADEIGVAPLYFEEKLDYLVKEGFMRETGGKYITNFCLYPKQIYTNYNYENGKIYTELGREMTEAIASCADDIAKIGFYGADMPLERLMWIYIVLASDQFAHDLMKLNHERYKGEVAEGNGRPYRIMGTYKHPEEEVKVPTDFPKGCSWSNLHNNFKTSGYHWVDYANLFETSYFGASWDDRDNIINETNIDLFMRIFDDPKLALSETDEEKAATLIARGYLESRDDGLYPTMPILSQEQYNEVFNILVRVTKPLAERYYERLHESAKRILLPATRRDLMEEFVNWVMENAFFPVSWIFAYAMESEGILELPCDRVNTSIATHLTYNK